MAEPSLFSALRSASRRVKEVGPFSRVDNRGGWFPFIRESFPGAWQQNVEVRQDLVLANWVVFACMTLIAGDIGKLRLLLVEKDEHGIWSETESAAFSPVLRKPNRYQTRQKFIEQWVLSKLSHGNTYVLKQRDQRGVVTALYVLDPNRASPLVAPDGAVYYQLHGDDLAQIPGGLPAVPASEVIHDIMWPLFHPLCGVSPLYASGLAATQGLKIQDHSAKFFGNMARPSGILTAPGQISDDTAKRLKEHWESNYAGNNAGKVAVLGDALKYEPMTQNAVDSELVEQLKLTAVMVCSTFHVPPHMVGAGPVPTNNNVEALEVQYYSKALQGLIEAIEALLDEGLGLVEKKDGRQLGTYFELDDLLKMDKATLLNTLKVGVDGSIMAPNEARRRINLAPVEGGDSPMSQQQNFSLAALHERDSDKPFAKPTPAPAAPPPAATDPEDVEPADDEAGSDADEALGLAEYIVKGLACAQM